MAIYKRDIASINLETGTIHRTFLNHSIGYKDQKADHFGIRVFRDGEPVDLTGVSVQGVFMPPQGDPIAITSGNIVSGNEAEVVLPQACYNYDGQFTLSIKLVDATNAVTGTMRIVDGMVDNTHASGTVAPTSAVPTYQEILSTYDAMVAATAAANGAIAATYSSSSTYKVGDYCIHDGGLYRCTTAITTAEAWTSGHWTAAKIGPDVSDLKSAINPIVYNYDNVEHYLYKANTYIKNGTETTLNGYDLYLIPVIAGDLFQLNQVNDGDMFYGALNYSYALTFIKNGQYEAVIAGPQTTYPNYEFNLSSTNLTHRWFRAYIAQGVTAVGISVKRGNESYFTFVRNRPGFILNNDDSIKRMETAYKITENNAVVGNVYKRSNGFRGLYTSGYSIRTCKLKTGDKAIIQQTTAIDGLGWFTSIDTFETQQVTSSPFIAPTDGYLDTFYYTGDSFDNIVCPYDSILVSYDKIIGIPDRENPYYGLSAVAFGTSLTYRAQTSYGYLQYLPGLSEMTFDNQGIGSSTILGNMLTAIKSYNGYSGKNVCLLEGFVNDWYQGLALGTYKDTEETSVCGCVRSALNYIFSQNANITVFLVLDPYGKKVGNVDCRSFAVNPNNLTQKEFYDEIAKVAESLGVPVIKLYADSQISENTPQYLTDNIHPTALGAKQTANTIWSYMKQHVPNAVE